MIQTVQVPTTASCPCQQQRAVSRRPLSGIDWTDWKIWALAGAAALILWLAFSNTPNRQARSVRLRQARAKYRAEQERIREEFA